MEEQFKEYAKLLVEIGVNIQRGQNLVITSPVECAWFARLCAQAAYDAGCREVVMNWKDDALSRMKYLHAAGDVFDTFPAWQSAFYNGYAKEGAAYLVIAAEDPENLKGVAQDRITRARRSSSAATEDFRRLQMCNGFPWCIASIPIPSWAGKVFPDKNTEEAMAKLWSAIFSAVRITGRGDAVERWHEHLDTLEARVKKLNELDLESLHYTNSLGTDLVIRLPEDHIWTGGNGATTSGTPFIVNIPTEEIFTAPLKEGVDGVVYASMPLSHEGNLIDRFSMTVQRGKIVEVHAEAGEEALKAAVSVDEGASFFGEVALVPYDSPISRQKLLFYNTLFDENASCHLAFGEAYPECVQGGPEMSKEELKECGLNDSITHVDFMVGTPDLQIMGRAWDGTEIPIFVDGNFAPALNELP